MFASVVISKNAIKEHKLGQIIQRIELKKLAIIAMEMKTGTNTDRYVVMVVHAKENTIKYTKEIIESYNTEYNQDYIKSSNNINETIQDIKHWFPSLNITRRPTHTEES